MLSETSPVASFPSTEHELDVGFLDSSSPLQSEPDTDAEKAEAGTHGEVNLEIVTYEVSWNGDGDPACPKNMSLVRKWIIITIVCTGSLCV